MIVDVSTPRYVTFCSTSPEICGCEGVVLRSETGSGALLLDTALEVTQTDTISSRRHSICYRCAENHTKQNGLEDGPARKKTVLKNDVAFVAPVSDIQTHAHVSS